MSHLQYLRKNSHIVSLFLLATKPLKLTLYKRIGFLKTKYIKLEDAVKILL